MDFFTNTNVSSAHTTFNQPLRVLIVEGDSGIRSQLRMLIGAEDREIFESASGSDAIAKLKVKDIVLVLLNMQLPDTSGLDVMDWISNFKISTNVIMISAGESIDSVIRAFGSGIMDFIRTPYDPEVIRHKVDNALGRSRQERNKVMMAAQLEQSERLHRFMVESSPDIIYTLDASGCFIFVNGRIVSLLGYERDELIGRKYTTIVHDDDIGLAQYAFTERRSDNRATTNVEVRLKSKNNCYRQFETRHIVAMVSSMGVYVESSDKHNALTRRFMGTYGVARDISERKVAEESISFQALHDHLTQLPNRRLFKDRLELSVTQSMRNGGLVGVMFIDLDRFKLVNDTYGHAEGDTLLKSLAQRLRGCVRAGDTLARQGGDEFTVLLPDLKHNEDAGIIAEKIMDVLKIPFIVGGQEFRATTSIGIAVSPSDGSDADELMKNADIAMYKVKASGKNNYQFYSSDMNACCYERVNFENELRQAIKSSEFELHYQPQFSVCGDRVVGLEALVRWRHPVHGLLDPARFIEAAEESGLICNITDWVLGEACRQIAHWRDVGMDDLRISINISPLDLVRNDIVERIINNINAYRLPENVLEIEITENLLMHDVSGVCEKMWQLHDQGVRISIDDFGTRYSSLNYLNKFPISTIKIDRSFVQDICEEKGASPIIHAIVGIARGFGLLLVAEGVESTYQMNALYDLGCDEMQGFLFSKPLPAEEVESLLKYSLSNATALAC